ncbi:LOW QUALITY PROTEIN: hypothetical protein U9M48_001525 [Paspalum notatum var. saurae]|uniref:Retrotransposon gag domain-containing protein n=1 Tax=Paspalum notatum var. saurae TaxID=547442 RepID=A0AAQ3SFA0_PASNO
MMHFSAAAACWLPSVEKKLRTVSWEEFCHMLLVRFGRDQHEIHILDRLTAYKCHTDPLHYTMRFIEGLRPELKAAVLMQQPSDLDTAYILSQLQEEVTGASCKDSRRPDAYSNFKPVGRGPYPLPLPPPKQVCHGQRIGVPWTLHIFVLHMTKWPLCGHTGVPRGYVSVAQRNGLVITNALPSVQLHVLQEVWDLFQIEDDQLSQPADQPSEQDSQLFLTLSAAAAQGTEGPRTVRFHGRLFDRDVLILVDSGSTHTTVSSRMLADIPGICPLPSPIPVQVVNGTRMQCSAQMLSGLSVQACSFISNLKILELHHFDMIVGMDWLEQCSHMCVHWKQKWLDIPYQGATICMQGLVPSLPEGSVIAVCTPALDEQQVVVDKLQPEMRQLLLQYSDVFDKPTGLPPARHYDHTIPLIAGNGKIRRLTYLELYSLARKPAINVNMSWHTPLFDLFHLPLSEEAFDQLLLLQNDFENCIPSSDFDQWSYIWNK